MISGNSKLISHEKYLSILSLSERNGLQSNFEVNRHQWVISNSDSWLARVSVPWNSFPNELGLLSRKDDFHLALVMIRAGIAVTGYFHNGEMMDHKVFRAYMVRQKQGKSQIKYLKTKGKSRAGSRLRLGESDQFFNEINQRLQQYAENFAIDMWGVSCSKTLWPYFFGSETPTPFSKNADNLFTVPFHVQQPDFETLKDIHKKLNAIHLTLSEAGTMLFEENLTNNPKSDADDKDDW